MKKEGEKGKEEHALGKKLVWIGNGKGHTVWIEGRKEGKAKGEKAKGYGLSIYLTHLSARIWIWITCIGQLGWNRGRKDAFGSEDEKGAIFSFLHVSPGVSLFLAWLLLLIYVLQIN